MTRDLQCEPSTLAGPLDQRVVAKLQQRYPLEPEFLECMALNHGGIPNIAAFEVGSTRRCIGQFLTLLDAQPPLTQPPRPHFEESDMDERVVNGICYLMDYDHATSRALFKNVVPFAALDRDMCLDRAYVDLLCLDYRNNRSSPAVILWVAHLANSAFGDWDDLPITDRFDDSDNLLLVPWVDFGKPVADNFSEFLEMLQPID